MSEEELKVRRDEVKCNLDELGSLIHERLKERTVDDEVFWMMTRLKDAMYKYWYELSVLIDVLEEHHD